MSDGFVQWVFEGIYQRTYPSINAKKSNSNEELVQVGEDVPLVGKDGGKVAVEVDGKRGYKHCWEKGEEPSNNSTNAHSEIFTGFFPLNSPTPSEPTREYLL